MQLLLKMICEIGHSAIFVVCSFQMTWDQLLDTLADALKDNESATGIVEDLTGRSIALALDWFHLGGHGKVAVEN